MATQEAMVNWAKNNLYRWIDMDGMYGAQCVDLTMAYTQYLVIIVCLATLLII